MSATIHDECAHGVIESRGIIPFATDTELSDKIVDHRLGRSGKAKVRFVDSVGKGISLEHAGNVMFRIERNGKKLNVGKVIGENEVLQSSHTIGGCRTHLRHRATSENKVQDGALAVEKVGREQVAVLIEESKRGKIFTNGADRVVTTAQRIPPEHTV